MQDLNTPIVISEEIDWTEINGEIVILNANNEQVYSLQDTGTDIWHELVVGTTPSAIIEKLQTRYVGLDKDIAEKDLVELLMSFRENLLIG